MSEEAKNIPITQVSAPARTSTQDSQRTQPPGAENSSSTSSLLKPNDPITQVNSHAQDAPITGAKLAASHHHAEEKKGFCQTLFSCGCSSWFPSLRGSSPQSRRQSIPAQKTVLPPSRPQDILLKTQSEKDKGRKCLVLDLDETLVHSSFKPVPNADFIIPVEIENQIHNVFVMKRPGVDEFMRVMGQYFEIVVFTASLAKYADPVLDKLDIHQVVTHRLFRESCYFYRGSYVKDLSRLGRDLRSTLIIDNAPASYMFQPENALACTSWIDDPNDNELAEMTEFLIELAGCENVIETLLKAQTEARG